MKLLKWALIVLGAVVVVLAGVLAFIAATFDPNQYKNQVADLVKEKTQRTLVIEGDIKLMLFPKIGVQLGKTRLSEFRSDKEFAGLDEIRVSLALFPLLSKRVVVDQVQLSGLRASLIGYKNGKTNFDDLLGGGDTATAGPAPAAPAATPPIKLDIDGVKVTKAAVSWRDEATGAEYAVSDLDIKTGRMAPGVPTKFALSAVIRANQPRVDVKVQSAGTLTADLEKQVFSVAEFTTRVNGEAAGIRELAAQLQADVEAQTQIRQVRVTGLKLEASGGLGKDSFSAKVSSPKIELNAGSLSVTDLVANVGGVVAGIVLSEGSLRAPQLRMNLASQNILIEGLALAVNGKRDADSFALKLDAPRLDVTKDRAAGADVTATVRAQGPQLDASANLKLSGVEGSAKALRIGQFLIGIDARQADNVVKGTLATPIAANLETRVFQLPKLAGEFEVTSPALPMKKLRIPLSGSVGADLKKQAVNANLTTKFDESNVKARFAMTNFAAPFYNFDVAIDKLNVDKYLPPKKADTTAKPAAGPEKEQPIDFSVLKNLRLAGSIRIGDLTASNVKAQNVRVDIKAKDGKLDVNPLSANLYQGGINGTASVNANNNQLAIKQNLGAVAIGPLLRDALSQDILDGRGNIALDVTATGNTVTAIKKTLSGSASLSLKDGAIKGINLAQSLRNAKSMFAGGANEKEQGAVKTEKTDFSEFTASFVIKNGKAHNGDLLAKSPFLRLSGEGDIDIVEGSLNYLAKAAVVATSTGQGGKEFSDLKGLTIPVRAYGPFAALKYKLDFGSALAGSAKQRLEEKKETLKGGLEDKLKSRLLGAPKPAEQQAVPAGGSAETGQSGQPAQAAPQPKPEDKLKEKLKKLF